MNIPVLNPASRPQWLHPFVFFAGAIMTFSVCCWLGRNAVNWSQFGPFPRLHKQVAPEGLYYPTAKQIWNMALRQLDPKKISVIVGGDSVMYGLGHSVEDLWSTQLQNVLGDHYQVLNVALSGGHAQEIGLPLTEYLLKQNRKAIYLTGARLGVFIKHPDGSRFRYFFWDARFKGFIGSYADRENHLKELFKQRRKEEEFRELVLQMRLNAPFYFNDLWQVIGYEFLFTVWTPSKGWAWARARKYFSEKPLPPPPPSPKRYNPTNDNHMLELVREQIAKRDEKEWKRFDRSARSCAPENIRAATIVAVTPDSPYYLRKLKPEEEKDFMSKLNLTVSKLQTAGYRAFLSLTNGTDDDFVDWVHLSKTGAQKFAAETAVQTRDLAHELGYLSSNP